MTDDRRNEDDMRMNSEEYSSRNMAPIGDGEKNFDESEKFNTEKIYTDDRYMRDKIQSYSHYSDYTGGGAHGEYDGDVFSDTSYEHISGDGSDNIYYDNLDSDDIRRIIKEEYETKYKPKNRWLSNLAASMFGAVLTALVFTFLLPSMYSKADPKIISESPSAIQINTTNEMSVEAAVNQKSNKSVVGVTTLSERTNDFFMQKYMTEGVGSGVVVSADGYILTNSHVVNDGNATKIDVVFADKEVVPATLMWYEPELDLAVIKVEKTDLVPIEIGNSDEIMVGDKAIAIGNPLGLDLQSTLTSGYISGLNRNITLQSGNSMDGLIQTDAAINGGNSGGALLNSKGQLIGINTAKAQGGEGIGFAIPVNTAKAILHRIETSGNFEPVLLGIRGVNLDYYIGMTGTKFQTDKGIMVLEIVANSPADTAGIVKGDIITAIDGKPVDNLGKLKQVLLEYNIGDKVEVTILRDNLSETLNLSFSGESR